MSADSILTTIKKLLGIEEDYTNFDMDLILHINSVFAVLRQLGLGPPEGYSITDKEATWADFLGDDPRLSTAVSFTYLKVKLLFDPPASSSSVESMNNIIKEFEWRLYITADEEVNK